LARIKIKKSNPRGRLKKLFGGKKNENIGMPSRPI